MAGSVHPVGDLVGAGPLGGVDERAPFRRPAKQGRDVPIGAEVTLGVEFKNNGNSIFVTAQAPNRSLDAGKFTSYMPSECPALKTERKSENTASSEPQNRPLLGNRYDPLDCSPRRTHSSLHSRRIGHIPCLIVSHSRVVLHQ